MEKWEKGLLIVAARGETKSSRSTRRIMEILAAIDIERRSQPRPLVIAFMGYNARTTRLAFAQFTADNKEQIERIRRAQRGELYFKDGTRIFEFPPSDVGRGLDGCEFDQLILADDRRRSIYLDCFDEIAAFRSGPLARSCVPEEYQIQFYDLDAPAPGERGGKQ